MKELRTISLNTLYIEQHPERIATHRAVNEALHSGRLAKPMLCQRCSRPQRLDAHHNDYRKPLKVVWLCRACHCYVHPRTQVNAKKKPTFHWQMTATADDIAAAMKKVREHD